MACLKIRTLEGNEVLIPEDNDGVVHHKVGDEIIGTVWDCGPNTNTVNAGDLELEKAGIPWGDAIAWATSKLGIQKCTACAARQHILNSAAKLGWKETLRQIRETL